MWLGQPKTKTFNLFSSIKYLAMQTAIYQDGSSCIFQVFKVPMSLHLDGFLECYKYGTKLWSQPAPKFTEPMKAIFAGNSSREVKSVCFSVLKHFIS